MIEHIRYGLFLAVLDPSFNGLSLEKLEEAIDHSVVVTVGSHTDAYAQVVCPQEVLPVMKGKQYTSDQFHKLLVEQGITCSMSRGEVWENPVMESFFSTLKIERVNRRGIYKTRKEVKADVFYYIECFYNPKRRYSTIGYVSPAIFESMQYA